MGQKVNGAIALLQCYHPFGASNATVRLRLPLGYIKTIHIHTSLLPQRGAQFSVNHFLSLLFALNQVAMWF